MAVGINDGWKNVSKRAPLAYMINVDYTAYTVGIEDISTLPKTADNHLKIVKAAIAYCEEELGTKVVGWVSDAGGESRAMRVRLHPERPDLLLFDCWVHQIQLILADILKLRSELVKSAIKAGGRAHTYSLPNITRWTSHYLSAEGLLEDRGPLQATVALHRDELKHIGSRHPECTQHVLSTVEPPEFWDKLAKLTTYIRPLAIALNIAQASDTRLDHILISLGNLFNFSTPLTSSQKSESVQSAVSSVAGAKLIRAEHLTS
ncbi:hypothetical protein FRC08_014059 [Ceratobasidium sp. 394]|nr:hypothetical protein FRC08_014059 [Ceratobasidium sp. 394]KAG9095691.1 hypothetical protein FS749_009999 [Ceratobasidium sp. UAMH 11750]